MRLTVVFLILCVMESLSAQLALRPMVGVNSAKFTTDFGDDEFQNQLGYQFGADVMIGGRLYFAPGVLFEVVNTELNITNGDNASVKLSRLNIPVHVGFKILPNATDRAFNIRVFAGPNVALNVSKDADENDNFEVDNIKDAVWGWDVGVGVDFLIFFVDAGYRFGLSEVFDDEVVNSSKEDVFTANAGVRIRF